MAYIARTLLKEQFNLTLIKFNVKIGRNRQLKIGRRKLLRGSQISHSPHPRKRQPKLSGITNPTIDVSILERKGVIIPIDMGSRFNM